MTTYADVQLSLPSGAEGEPLFSSPEEYERFVDNYTADVAPILKEYEDKRRRSEEAARQKWVS